MRAGFILGGLDSWSSGPTCSTLWLLGRDHIGVLFVTDRKFRESFDASPDEICYAAECQYYFSSELPVDLSALTSGMSVIGSGGGVVAIV